MPSHTCGPILWDPRAVLKLDNLSRCAGWASTRGRRCYNFIAHDNQQKAETLIATLSTKEPDAVSLVRDLGRLAGLLLCRRWHQNQANGITRNWSAEMEHLTTGETAEEESENTDEAEEVRGENEQGHPRHMRTSVRSWSVASSTPSLSRVIPRSSRSFDTPSHPSTLSRTGTSSSPSSSSGSQILALDTPTLPRLSISEGSTTLEAFPATSNAQLSQSTQTQYEFPEPSSDEPLEEPVPPPRSCASVHVRRLAIDDDCPICHDEFLLQEQNDLVWCKSGCGHTVHRTCFERWKEACEEGERTVNCGVCRTAWVDDCDCE